MPWTPSASDVGSLFQPPRSVPEQLQVHGIGQRLVAGIGRMPMVAAVVERKYPRRGIGVTQYPVKVEDLVILTAAADPCIDRLTLDLTRCCEDRERGSRHQKPFHRSQGAAENLESFRMRALDELLVTLDDLIGGDLLGSIQCEYIV